MLQKGVLIIFVQLFLWNVVGYFQSASQPDVLCHAIEPAHVQTGPASEAAFPSLPHGEDDVPPLGGDRWLP